VAQSIRSVAIVVRDYDEAIRYYTECLGFELVADDDLGNGKRWVQVVPPGSNGTRLLLARAAKPEQESRIGNQTGGRVFLFLETDNFRGDHARMKQRGVRFIEDPREEEYGTVAVFEDLYGNRWDFVQYNRSEKG
jgi:catechol 2,3-dioxygenase-like lactoylglutathione lyase family enzyme